MFVTFYAKCSILRHFFYDLYDIFQIQHDLVYGHLIHDVHILRCNVNELIHCDRDKPWMRHAKHNLYHRSKVRLHVRRNYLHVYAVDFGCSVYYN